MAPEWSAIEWSRPAAFAALVVPLLVAWLARRAPRAELAPTATVDLWLRAASVAPSSGTPRRARWSWPLIAALAALTLGVVALAGPRWSTPPERRVWRIVLDTSPSMFLLHVEPGATSAANAGGPRRIDRALDAALERLQRAGVATNEREWLRWLGDRFDSAQMERPPASWLETPRAPRDAPPFARFDEPLTIWITDHLEAAAPQRALAYECGGGAVAGPISLRGSELVVWDGAQLATRSGAPAEVAVDAALPESLRELVQIWANALGFIVVRNASRSSVLEIRFASNPPTRVVELSRDGWRARASIGAAGVSRENEEGPLLEPWLVFDNIAPVAWCPGWIECALGSLEPLDVDAAAFAVSWSRLFDTACVPAAGVIALGERIDAGAPRWTEPKDALAPEQDVMPRTDERPAAWIATLAALLAFAALVGATWTTARRGVTDESSIAPHHPLR